MNTDKINNNLVSIIIPIFNCEKFLVETIESVLSQTYQDWELLLIDDCSTDKSYQIAQSYQKKDIRIILLQNHINSGQAYTRNQGLNVAKGRYIAFLDSDDLWSSTKLEIHIQKSVEKKTAFSYSDFELIDEDSNKLGVEIHPTKYLSFKKFLKYNPVGCLTIFYDRNVIGNPLFTENKELQSLEDNIFCADIFKHDHFSYIKIPTVLAYYRVRSNSSSAKKIVMFKKRISMLKYYFKLSWPSTIFNLSIYIIRNMVKYFRIYFITIRNRWLTNFLSNGIRN